MQSSNFVTHLYDYGSNWTSLSPIRYQVQRRSISKMYVSAGSEASQKVKIVSCEVQIVAANNSSKFLTFYKIIFYDKSSYHLLYLF